MSIAERRNLYRILHVQPEAPDEVIKSSYRTLMSRLRAHPDLGGNTEHAARLNAAYAVLSDPAQRRDYDASLRRGTRGPSAGPAFDPLHWIAARRCPFCRAPIAGQIAPGLRCTGCDCALGPAPAPQHAPSEILGRRRGPRHARPVDARLRLPGETVERPVRLRDLSLTGLSLVAPFAVPRGTPISLRADTFETVALTVACRPATLHWTVHARLLTLEMLRRERGVWLNARA